MKKTVRSRNILKHFLAAGIILAASYTCDATTKTSVQSGAWSNPSTWFPSGVPAAGDNAVIASTNTVTFDADNTIQNLTVNAGGTLVWAPSKRLTLNGNIVINGTANMNKGEISLASYGLGFTLGPNSVFTWDPGTNTSAAATLFTRGNENFSATSTLIIKNWYNYTLALGSVVSGNFGNLTLNSPGGNSSIVEWNQQNEFQTHKIQGTLTVDQGWITLDRSGSITNTNIGSLVLTSVNSCFYGHNGTHPGSFTLSIGSVSNNGGIFYGLNNGNGNITVDVAGNFSNTGNVKIINNGGVLGVCNGNASFHVGGSYLQTMGDTRFIYNVTTTQSGTFNASINSLTLTGGIFMGQTGIHVQGGTSTLAITNNCTINFTSASDKFRCTSLSSISGTVNNVKVYFTVGGNLTFSGPGDAEFTSTASAGAESVTIGGNLQISSGAMAFNFGTTAASHDLTMLINGDVIVNGGTSYLSKNSGTASITVGGKLQVSNGNLVLKGASGNSTMNLTGNYEQNGGIFYLHSNGTTATPNPVNVNIQGSFNQTAGTLFFDDNSYNTSAEHSINLFGKYYTIGGTGIITHGGQGVCSVFGKLRFNGTGEHIYNRTSTTHSITQVKVEVAGTGPLQVNSGNLLIPSGNIQAMDYFKICSGASVNLNSNQMVSDGLSNYSGIQIDSAATLSIKSRIGLYDGSTNAAISSAGNLNYNLNANSIIEYSGDQSQVLTGSGNGVSTTINHQYGILKINKTGNVNVAPAASNVTVRTQLVLESGELRLNGKIITLSNGKGEAIKRYQGYIYSENEGSIFCWKNISSGVHQIPFGLSKTTYLPVTFTPVSGFPSDIKASTRKTDNDNKPFPAGVNLTVNDTDIAKEQIIDRWWNFSSGGLKAKVTLSYSGSENSLSTDYGTGLMSIYSWEGTQWSAPQGSGSGVKSGIGEVTVNSLSFNSYCVIGANTSAPAVQLSNFDVRSEGTEVHINWSTLSENNNAQFTIERSTDGVNFESIQQVDGAGNSSAMLNYSSIDKSPLNGVSYYRLKQTTSNGKSSFSEVKTVTINLPNQSVIKIKDVGPNPFEDSFKVNYALNADGLVKIALLSLKGETIFETEQNGTTGENQFDYKDNIGLRAGIYILQIKCKDQVKTQKLIKN